MNLNQPAVVVMTCATCHGDFPPGVNACPKCGAALVAETDPMVGSTFDGRYEILERIGRGGMGIVYKAKHKHIDQIVAIKILYKQYSKDQASIERFKREANTLVSLKHQNILTVHGFGITPDDQPFLIMEYLEGTTLADFLEQHGRMPLERALSIFVRACDGLAHAHERGVIHRDLKPGNLMLVQERGHVEEVKIVDFGIAKIKPRDGKEAQNLTKAGEIFGSPLYMSPEQCQGKELDERSDIYSLGCVIYETLTGMTPLMGINSFETMTKHVNEQPASMRTAAPELALPELIDAAVMKSLNKEPQARQSSVRELSNELIFAAQNCDFKSFATGQLAALGPHDEILERLTGQKQHRNDEREKEELREMMQTAVQLAQKKDAHANTLRQMLLLLYCLLGLGVIAGVIYFTKSGPKEDPAPNWQKQAWRLQMDAGDKAEASKDYTEAIASYKDAERIGKQMGPIYDKEIKAQLQLMVLYDHLHMFVQLRNLQHDIIISLAQREKTMYGEEAPDVEQVRDLDDGFISSGQLKPETLDPEVAHEYSRILIQNAKECYEKKKYNSAESWLLGAIKLEERAHGQSKGELAKTARDFAHNASPEGKEHIHEIEALLKRAEAAEKAQDTARNNGH